MKTQGSSSVSEVAEKEDRLAAQHKRVGDLLRDTMHAGNFQAEEQHLK